MSECMGRWFADEPEIHCAGRAVVCSECVRALALKWWGGIARHGDGSCVLCGLGFATHCGDHAIAAATHQRALLREQGTRIGEPEWVPS